MRPRRWCFERYRDADAAIEHFSNISHLMEPLMATASVTGEVLGTPNANMKEELAKGRPEAVHAVDGVAGSGIGGGAIIPPETQLANWMDDPLPRTGVAVQRSSSAARPKDRAT